MSQVSPFSNFKIHHIVLTPRKIATCRRVDPVLDRADFTINEYSVYTRRDMEFHLRSYILGRQISSVDFVTPSGWVEMLKAQLYERFPVLSWAKRRWPVQVTTTTLTAWQAFPEYARPEFSNTLLLASFSD